MGVLPGSLPRQLTSFIGRERELRDLKELLERSRLLTLTGPGGGGKTRLGLQLAAEVASGFPGGVYFVALAPVGNPDLVLSSIAQGVGLGDVGNRPLLERLCSHLESARVLLLLDNFEHLTVSAPVVAALLQATAELARAEGALASARSFLFDTITRIWATACGGDEPNLGQRALVLLAANQAVRAATEAVDRVFRLAGAGAVYTHHPLQRCFRDVHAAGQHILFSAGRDQAYAKVRLGIGQPTFLI